MDQSPIPRTNGKYINQYNRQLVRIIGQVKDENSIMTTDECLIRLVKQNPGPIYNIDTWIEVQGFVNVSDHNIVLQEVKSYPIPINNQLDVHSYNHLIDFMHKYPDIFH